MAECKGPHLGPSDPERGRQANGRPLSGFSRKSSIKNRAGSEQRRVSAASTRQGHTPRPWSICTAGLSEQSGLAASVGRQPGDPEGFSSENPLTLKIGLLRESNWGCPQRIREWAFSEDLYQGVGALAQKDWNRRTPGRLAPVTREGARFQRIVSCTLNKLD